MNGAPAGDDIEQNRVDEADREENQSGVRGELEILSRVDTADIERTLLKRPVRREKNERQNERKQQPVADPTLHYSTRPCRRA